MCLLYKIHAQLCEDTPDLCISFAPLLLWSLVEALCLMRDCCWSKVTSSLSAIMVNHWGEGKCSQTLPQGQLEHTLTLAINTFIAWRTYLSKPLPWTLWRGPAVPQAHLSPLCSYASTFFFFSFSHTLSLFHVHLFAPVFTLSFSQSFVLTYLSSSSVHIPLVAWFKTSELPPTSLVLQFKKV